MTNEKGHTKTALIIGAGPAGLTTAFELLKNTDIRPVIIEKSGDIGGISKTVNYKGNRIDLGGHRFFSKSDTVMQWWQDIFNICETPDAICKNEIWETPNDEVFLKRERLSRIYYLRKFFDYPVSLNKTTIQNLGLLRMMRIGFSYLKARLFPIRNEQSLEDFFINRFGKALYETFFKDYTEKVWGIPCSKLSAEWGAQRVKGLSVSKVLWHYLKSFFAKKSSDISQKDKETSLIDRFLYPKFGPGQLWEKVAENVVQQGAELLMHCEYRSMRIDKNGRFVISYYNHAEHTETTTEAYDYVFSTTTVKDLLAGLEGVPGEIRNISDALLHRNFITVGLLLNKLNIRNTTHICTRNGLIPDNWIYVQEPDVTMGRIQIFNNWSPFMVSDASKVWLGLEYFCNPDSGLWNAANSELCELAIAELERMGIATRSQVIDTTVLRMENTYPVYYGAYDKFDSIRAYTDSIPNLFLIGRSGMHRYNNSDHSMLTAITAVQNIVNGIHDKSNIWLVNTEQDYHEEKK